MAIKRSKIGIAVDLWHDKVTNVTYFGFAAHYIVWNEGKAPELKSRALRLIATDANMEKNASLLSELIRQVLCEYDLFEDRDSVVFISDRGANIVKSLEDFLRLSCIAHFFNNIVCKACDEITTLKTNVVRIVKYLKVYGKASNLSHHLHSFVATRWNTLYDVFDSFLLVFDEIRPKINEKRKDIIERYNRIDREALIAVREFLKKFKMLTTEVEGDTMVTAVKLLPIIELLQQHVAVDSEDPPIVRKMKLTSQKYIEENLDVVLPVNYGQWAFFQPQFKKLTGFKSINKENVLASIKLAIEISEQWFPQDTNSTTVDENFNIEMHMEQSIFSQFEDCGACSTDDSISNEIEKYMNMTVAKVDNILEWWENHKALYPSLYKYFLSFAAVPITSASAERLFSTAHNIITDKRNRLSTDIVEMLLFLNKNV